MGEKVEPRFIWVLPLSPTILQNFRLVGGSKMKRWAANRIFEVALAPYPNVILLLPSPDLNESVDLLKNRLTWMLNEAGKAFTGELFELNKYFVTHPSNRQLAKLVIYTKDKTPEIICDEIIRKLV